MNPSEALDLLILVALHNAAMLVGNVLALAGCVIIGCRVAKMMRGVTELSIFIQHLLLALGLFGSVLLSFAGLGDWSSASISAGALSFLLMSLRRWRHAPPAGTVRAKPLDVRQLRHVAGGKRAES